MFILPIHEGIKCISQRSFPSFVNKMRSSEFISSSIPSFEYKEVLCYITVSYFSVAFIYVCWRCYLKQHMASLHVHGHFQVIWSQQSTLSLPFLPTTWPRSFKKPKWPLDSWPFTFLVALSLDAFSVTTDSKNVTPMKLHMKSDYEVEYLFIQIHHWNCRQISFTWSPRKNQVPHTLFI